jgi:hypothetical protein
MQTDAVFHPLRNAEAHARSNLEAKRRFITRLAHAQHALLSLTQWNRQRETHATPLNVEIHRSCAHDGAMELDVYV